MTTQKVLEIVTQRGLKIVLKDGRPVLERAASSPNVTDALMAVLKIHRERIIDILSKGRP